MVLIPMVDIDFLNARDGSLLPILLSDLCSILKCFRILTIFCNLLLRQVGELCVFDLLTTCWNCYLRLTLDYLKNILVAALSLWI